MATRYYDVVVVGGGNAAICAALSAHDQGARIAVLEAAPREERGGNSRFASTVYRIPHKGVQDIEPMLCDENKSDLELFNVKPYTPQMWLDDMEKTSDGHADLELAKVVIDHGLSTVQWMRDKGVKFKTSVRKFLDEEAIRAHGKVDIAPGIELMVAGEGVGLTDALWAAVERRHIDVFYECPAYDLLTRGDTVDGVRTRQTNGYVDFYGNVILGCGGFEASPRMRRAFLGEGWDLVVVRGTRFNTGHMLEKCIAAGAQATGHWGSCHASPQDLHSPRVGDLKNGDSMCRYSYPYSIMVNQDGKRFMDEGENYIPMTYAKTGAAIGSQPRGRAYQIFDQKTIGLLEPRYKTGKPITAATLPDLAKKLGINQTVFEDTVTTFNAACQPGKFDAMTLDGLATKPSLTPPKTNWAQKIDQGPYTAYEVCCGITFTYGGIKADKQARVLNNENKPMPGLWAVGEMTGGYFFFNYPGGAGLVKGSVFGKIAGEAAAKQVRHAPREAKL